MGIFTEPVGELTREHGGALYHLSVYPGATVTISSTTIENVDDAAVVAFVAVTGSSGRVDVTGKLYVQGELVRSQVYTVYENDIGLIYFYYKMGHVTSSVTIEFKLTNGDGYSLAEGIGGMDVLSAGVKAIT